jgi:hypothetical protein
MLDILGAFQYSPEIHICSFKMSIPWVAFLYMGTAIGIPFFGIIGIYLYIVRHTRRVIAVATIVMTSTRDLHVLKNILTLVGILGTAGLPSLMLIIWDAVSGREAPVALYLVNVLTISFCTNIQISFIFNMNKNVRVVFWNHLRRVFH